MIFEVQQLPEGVAHRVERRYHREALLANMPFAVTVEPEPRTAYASPCKCVTVYRIVDIEWLRKRELLRRGITANPCVCDCMGVTK